MDFIDTNVLLHAFGPDEDAGKSAIARSILAGREVAFSIQVFQEFFVQATHARRNDPLSAEEAREVIGSLTAFPVQQNDLSLLRDAFRIHERFQTSFWDANILAAARALGCEIVFSEDFNHGQDYDGVRVVNPFQPG